MKKLSNKNIKATPSFNSRETVFKDKASTKETARAQKLTRIFSTLKMLYKIAQQHAVPHQVVK